MQHIPRWPPQQHADFLDQFSLESKLKRTIAHLLRVSAALVSARLISYGWLMHLCLRSSEQLTDWTGMASLTLALVIYIIGYIVTLKKCGIDGTSRLLCLQTATLLYDNHAAWRLLCDAPSLLHSAWFSSLADPRLVTMLLNVPTLVLIIKLYTWRSSRSFKSLLCERY